MRKQSGSNTVDVAEAVKAALPGLNRELPGQTRLSVVRDSSEFIRDAVDDVKNYADPGRDLSRCSLSFCSSTAGAAR